MPGTQRSRPYDVVIVGAGVFGTWAAWHLAHRYQRVALVDAHPPGHARASSGGASRVTRSSYGASAVYAEWAWQSLAGWQALSERRSLPLLQPRGMLSIHRADAAYYAESGRVLDQLGIPRETLASAELRRRYPVLHVAEDELGFLEPSGGALLARRATQALAEELTSRGVAVLREQVLPVTANAAGSVRLDHVMGASGQRIMAERFVFAAGPWLGQLCPDVLAERLFATRQQVHYLQVPAEITAGLPVWADLPYYGFPALDGRGFKLANHELGPRAHPDEAPPGDDPAALDAARGFLRRRFPALADAPLQLTETCYYENSAGGDFLLDQHPCFDNAWLAGGGSGHGFKHGPAVGAHVAALVSGRERPRAPFLLAARPGPDERTVQ